MDIKEMIKKFWFIGLIAIALLVFIVIYAVQAYQNRPIYVDTKTDNDGNYIVYSIEGENLLANDLYDNLYEDLGASTAYTKWSRQVISKAIKTTEQLNTYASNYANYIAAYNDQATIDSALKQYGYANGFDDLLEYCLDMVKADELYKDFYSRNFDTYVKPLIDETHPKRVYHILVKVENVEEVTDEDGNTSLVANMSEEEQTKLNSILEALEKGEAYADVCAKYSDEDSTKDKGGYLGIYDDTSIAQQMVKEFSDAVIALDYDTVSEPVLSEFGYHIIKVEMPTDDELKADNAFMSEVSNHYTYSNIIALKEKADELGFEIKDEKLNDLINQYIEQAASEIVAEADTPVEETSEGNESEDGE